MSLVSLLSCERIPENVSVQNGGLQTNPRDRLAVGMLVQIERSVKNQYLARVVRFVLSTYLCVSIRTEASVQCIPAHPFGHL